MPRWASVSSLNSSSSSRSGRDVVQSALEPSLLTTCVGSMSELIDLISKVAQAGHCPIPLTTRALHALFYYMRCSQVYTKYSLILKELKTYLRFIIMRVCAINLIQTYYLSSSMVNVDLEYKNWRTNEPTWCCHR